MRISDWSSDVCSSDLVERVEIHIRSFVLSRPRMLDLYRTYTYYLVKSIRVREGERMTPLLYEVEDGLAIVTLNRPAQMNATSPAMRELLIEATYRAETDDAVRAVLIRGAGEQDRKSTRLNSSHSCASRMPASA